VGLRDDTQLDKAIAPMVGAGYTYFKKYEPAMPYRRLFARLRPLTDQAPPELIDVHDAFVRGQTFISVVNIHVVVKDTPHWTRHLAFRDYLRAHSDVRDDYGLLKSALSRGDYRDTNEYNAAKERFIQETQARALAWYARQHETQADEVGLMLAAAACFDPRESVPLWERMSQSSGGQSGSEFASTHPNPGTRIANLQALMPKALEYRQRFCRQGG
jgi:GrpB-like predicted nucleotidyltransferase (UPF0157 family)